MLFLLKHFVMNSGSKKFNMVFKSTGREFESYEKRLDAEKNMHVAKC